MGSKYTSQASSGYNASPPSDDGSSTEANKVKWSTIKQKLSDVLKTFIEAVNSQLVTALDQSCRTVAASDSAAASDHDRTIQVTTSSVSITLADAATMAAGYVVTVANQSTGTITVALATATDTIDTVTNTTVSLAAKEARTYIVNSAATGYLTRSRATGAGTAIQTFLGADVALNNTANYFNICNTGSIGAAGQTWLILAVASMEDTAGAAQMLARIWDGSASVYTETNTSAPAAGQNTTVTLLAVVTLTAATTFHLSCKDISSTSGAVLTTGGAGTANKATSITAVRLS